jgi:hypothetical protein
VVCDADQLDRNGVRALTRVNCPNGTPVCEFCARGRETRLGRSGSAPNRELNLSEEVFLSSDKSQIYAGDLWLQKIKEALSAAELVILMLSQRSVARPWVNFEAGAAWLADKKVIPVCYGNLSKDALPHPYSAIQALNLQSEAY